MERFSYKDGCGIHERIHLRNLKEEMAWARDKWLWLIINTTLF